MRKPKQSLIYKAVALFGAPFMFFGAIGTIIYAILGIFMLSDLLESQSCTCDDASSADA